MKTVIITGCCGFIGSHFVTFYLKKGYRVVGFNKMTSTCHFSRDIKMYNVDLLSDYSKILMDEKPDFIIHCAGSANVSLSFSQQEEDFNNNVRVLYKLLDCVKKSRLNPKVIFFSSAAVYGNPERIPIKEEDNLKPISPYGLHKKICEDICLYYIQNENLDINIVRIFSAYGDGLKKQILWDMHSKLIANGKIELYGTGNETRDYIHINDLLEAVELIINTKKSEYVYNLANGEEVKVSDLAISFLKFVGYDSSFLSFSGLGREGDPVRWRADISKLLQVGYKPKINIEEGIYRYAQWLRSIKNE